MTSPLITHVPALFRWRAADGLNALAPLARSYASEVAGVMSRPSRKTVADRNGRLVALPAGVAPVHWINGELALLLERGRTNLALRSEDFSHATWAKLNITVTTNAIAAPDGTLTADLVSVTSTGDASLDQAIVAPSTTITYSLHLKRGTGATDGGRISLYNFTTAAELYGGTFNFDTGVFTAAGGSGSAAVTALGNGWYRLELTVSTGISVGNTILAYAGFLGAGYTGGIGSYLWGAQFEAGPCASSYIPSEGTAGTTTADALYFPLAAPPQALTLYVRGYDLGTFGISDARYAALHGSSDAAPRLLVQQNGSGVRGFHGESGGDVTSTAAQTPTRAAVVELRTVLGADGAITQAVSVNGATEVAGAASAANALASAWGSPARLYLGGLSTPGQFAFTHVAIAAGTADRATLRELAEV